MMIKAARDPINTIRAWYEAREPELLASDIRWDVLERFPSGGVYQGRDQVFETFFPAVAAAFPTYEVEVDDIWPTDRDEVVAIGYYIARRSSDGPKIRARFAHIWTVRSGQITQFRQVADTAASLKAAASVDQISNGRLVLGVASGDRPIEYPAYGIDPDLRSERFPG